MAFRGMGLGRFGREVLWGFLGFRAQGFRSLGLSALQSAQKRVVVIFARFFAGEAALFGQGLQGGQDSGSFGFQSGPGIDCRKHCLLVGAFALFSQVLLLDVYGFFRAYSPCLFPVRHQRRRKAKAKLTQLPHRQIRRTLVTAMSRIERCSFPSPPRRACGVSHPWP